MDEGRIRLAEELLREGVYRSRERQAAIHASAQAGCGLGEKPEVVLELSPRGRDLFGQLFVGGLDAGASGRFRATISAWIEMQDSLDRKRNHFLKAFRGRHGFERAGYSPAVLGEYEAGLAGIAAEEDGARRRAAEALAGV